VRYMSGDRGDQGLLQVGQPLREPLDLTVHELDAALSAPHDRKANVQATSPAGGPAAGSLNGSSSETVWQLEYPQTHDQGFYDLKLTRRDGGGEDHVLFAANVDPSEGDLKRVDRQVMEKDLADTNVKIIEATTAGSLADVGSQTEIWWYLLWAVVAVLCGEQLLGWFFGWGR
jgi:hypothetical protein